MDLAVGRALDLGCDTLQIFTKSNRQWAARRLDPAEVAGFRRGISENGLAPVFAHASYLINLAAAAPATRERSRHALVAELQRCDTLGIAGLVLHPGAHGGAGEETGLARVARSLEWLFSRTDGPRLLLEATAGQGNCLGHRLEQLAWLGERFAADRIGFCLDSCHLHAAGYALDSAARVRRVLETVDETVGLARVHLLHLNDSVGAAGSRLDRHAGIGEGTIGYAGFRALVRDTRLVALPAVLETPKGGGQHLDRLNLKRLRCLQSGRRPPPINREV